MAFSRSRCPCLIFPATSALPDDHKPLPEIHLVYPTPETETSCSGSASTTRLSIIPVFHSTDSLPNDLNEYRRRPEGFGCVPKCFGHQRKTWRFSSATKCSRQSRFRSGPSCGYCPDVRQSPDAAPSVHLFRLVPPQLQIIPLAYLSIRLNWFHPSCGFVPVVSLF
jgi:hypothetical protein